MSDGTMRAVAIERPGGPEVLQVVRLPVPEPGPGEVLVAVAAAGVNRPDLLQREGHYPPPPGASPLPGLEVAGQVERVGPGVGRWRPGDAVCALVAGGGYAERCVVPEPQCLPVPRGLSLVEAAALPEACFTVWTNVFERGGLRPGEWLLVHGGASGIGTTAIQMARALGAEAQQDPAAFRQRVQELEQQELVEGVPGGLAPRPVADPDRRLARDREVIGQVRPSGLRHPPIRRPAPGETDRRAGRKRLPSLDRAGPAEVRARHHPLRQIGQDPGGRRPGLGRRQWGSDRGLTRHRAPGNRPRARRP